MFILTLWLSTAGLSGFVKEIFTIFQYILNPFLHDGSLKTVFRPKNESEHVLQNWLWLGQQIFKPETEYRCFAFLNFKHPVFLPVNIASGNVREPDIPVWFQLFRQQALPECVVVSR